MLIDVHTHGLLPEHWGSEHKMHWEPAYGVPYPHVTPPMFDAAMTAAGVDVAIVFGLRATAVGVATPNTHIAQFCRAATTPTIAFSALDPTDPDWSDQLDEAIELGFQGVKLYPVLSLFDPAEPHFDRFYDRLARTGQKILWHMGATPSPRGMLRVSQPLILDEVARRHPSLTQIIAHMGHPWQRDTNVLLRKHPRVFADVSALGSRPLDGYLALRSAIEWNVVDKLLFGSDYPLWTPAAAIRALRAVPGYGGPDLPRVDPDVVEDILNRDALALLELDDPRDVRAP